jgi:hypothetical protein
MKFRTILILTVVFLLPYKILFAFHVEDTVTSEKPISGDVKLTPYHKNVIKINPTPMLLFSQVSNITLNYERVLFKNQSVSIQAGYLLIPRITDDTIRNLVALTGADKQGVNLALEYRYYPSLRNRRPAPDGLYIGGYLSYYGFKWKNSFDVLNTTVDQKGHLKGALNVMNLGMELGYQFVFWKRFTVDLLMFGPSLSYYHYDLSVSAGLDPELLQQLDEELVKRLIDRFPSLGEIFSSDGLTISGSKSQLSIGFRYAIMLGFHF